MLLVKRRRNLLELANENKQIDLFYFKKLQCKLELADYNIGMKVWKNLSRLLYGNKFHQIMDWK